MTKKQFEQVMVLLDKATLDDLSVIGQEIVGRLRAKACRMLGRSLANVSLQEKQNRSREI
jgi:hypothetical protein